MIGLRFRLEVEWEDMNKTQNLSDVFVVHIAMEGAPTCANLGVASTDWPHCAQFGNPNSCKNACGLGTGGSNSVQNR